MMNFKSRFYYVLIYCVFLTFYSQFTYAGIADNSVRFVAEQNGPLTLDPHIVLQETNVNFFDNIYEGLVLHDLDGNLLPALATRWKYINDTTIEFTLRQNVTFHNGEVFDAHSVKYSYDRFFDPQLKSQSAGLFMFYDHCEVVDNYTIRIHFSKPNGVYLSSSNYIKIIPAKYHQTNGEKYFEDYPVGTGPFKVVERRYNARGVTSEIKLVKFKHYWQPNLVKIDRLSYLYMQKEKATELLYQGKVDLIKDFDPALLNEAMNLGFAILRFDSGDTLNANFNTLYTEGLFNQQRPFLDKKVRHAVNLAIDRNAIMRNVFKGLAKKIGIPGYRSQGGYHSLRPYRYNPEKAKQLLAEAGYPDGFKDLFWVEDIIPNLGTAIKNNLKKIGIEATIRVENENLAMQTIVMPRYDESLPNPSMGAFVFTCPDFGIGHTFFLGFITYHTDGPWSITSDLRADELFNTAIGVIDKKESGKAWEEYHTYMREQHYYVPILQRVVAYAAAKKLKFHPGRVLDFTRTSWKR